MTDQQQLAGSTHLRSSNHPANNKRCGLQSDAQPILTLLSRVYHIFRRAKIM